MHRHLTPIPGRLVFVTARYPPFVGGTEVHTAEIAKRLVGGGADVVVLTTDTSASVPRDTVRDGVPVRLIPAAPEGGDFYFTRQLRRELRELRPDVVHVQGYHTFLGPMAMWASHSLGVPFVVTFHSGGHRSRLRNLLRPLHQRAIAPLFKRAAALVAVSDFEARLFARRTGIPRHQIHSIPSGAALRVIERSETPSRTVVTSLGRLERYKGHQELIRCLPHLLARRPDTELRLIGTGSYEGKLRKLVRSLDLDGHVRFLQVASSSRDELTELLMQSSLVTLLSAYESQGLAAFEAISLGIPVMVLESSALAELTEAGLAAAIPPHTPPSVLAALIDQQLRAPNKPRDVLPPGWEQTVSSLQQLYADTCGVQIGNGPGGEASSAIDLPR